MTRSDNDPRQAAPAAGTTRRDFLRRTAAAVAAGGALTAFAGEEDLLAAARERPVPRAPLRPRADGPVRLGVIGTGGMGTAHAQAFLKFAREGRADVSVVALADVCRPRLSTAYARCREAGADYPIATHFDYRRVLADPQVDAVVIASPEHWHGRMAEDAIAAGKDVYLEKPMTLDLRDALRLREVVRANPRTVFGVGTQYVMYSGYHEARKLIAEGAIGKPVWSQTSYCRNSKDGEWLYYAIDPSWEPGVTVDWAAWCGPLGEQPWDPEVFARWRRYRRYSTGIIGDLLVHRMTPLILALDVGWPTRVTASGGHYVDKAMENPDQVNLTVEFEGEHTMIVAGSTANEVGLETMIRGHKGNLYLGGNRVTLRPERIFAEEVEERTIEGPPQRDAQDQLRLHWLECIRERKEPISNIELGTRVMAIVDLATRSIWEGKAFAFDPERLRVRAL